MALLPPELCAIICDQVQDSDTLANLCRTSRLFQDRAQRILYHAIDLRKRPRRSVKSWALSVTRNAHLATRVHSLVLAFPETLDPSDATKIAGALHTCVNLKELELCHADLHPRTLPMHVWMIQDCPFRLDIFRNSYFSAGPWWMEKFWEAQTEIRALSVLAGTSIPNGTSTMPHLVAVHTPQFYDLPRDKPLQRIHANLDRNLSDLAPYAQSLTILNLQRVWMDEDLPLSSALDTIASTLPLLCHLWLVEKTTTERYLPASDRVPTPALRRLTKLQTFVFHVRNVDFFVDDVTDTEYFLEVQEDMRELGYDIMATQPTLRRVNLGAEPLDAAPSSQTCVLTRSPEGTILVEHGTEFDSEAASLFWSPL
ncbi:hypothetical protein FB45DRAFT_178443, partial [Roridomyces roridus]